MQFRCNVCDAANEFQEGGYRRDDASCGKCGSTVRMRGILHALTMQMFGEPLTLGDLPRMKSIRGIGMSDQLECASMLASRFDYVNTYYHDAPRFDISAPPSECGIYDFILAGDVFEHVLPPVRQSLANACALLKPHGFLAMTVPYAIEGHTQEHFPELHEFGLASVGGRLALVNRTRAGDWQVFDNLVFHGGPGSVLEVRQFSEADLRADLEAAGFANVRIAAEWYPPFGVAYSEIWSLPVIAAKEPFRLSRDGVSELVRQNVSALRLEAELSRMHAAYDERTRWALAMEAELKLRAEEAARRSEALTGSIEDPARRQAANELLPTLPAHLQSELDERTEWALRLDAEVQRREKEATRLTEELNQARFHLALWEVSRWTRLGRAFGLGPKFPRP